jgi:hypothetical protein
MISTNEFAPANVTLTAGCVYDEAYVPPGAPMIDILNL